MNICPLSGDPCPNGKIFHITEVEDNKATSAVQLCPNCIKGYLDRSNESNGSNGSEAKLPPMPGSVDLTKIKTPGDVMQTVFDFFKYVVEHPEHKHMPEKPPFINKNCTSCGITLKEIAKTGRLGCPQCYDNFGDELNVILQHTQAGALKHVGKVPKHHKEEIKKKKKEELEELPVEEKIKRLEKRLERVIKKEHYEKAAKIRDQIKKLKGVAD